MTPGGANGGGGRNQDVGGARTGADGGGGSNQNVGEARNAADGGGARNGADSGGGRNQAVWGARNLDGGASRTGDVGGGDVGVGFSLDPTLPNMVSPVETRMAIPVAQWPHTFFLYYDEEQPPLEESVHSEESVNSEYKTAGTTPRS